MPPPKDSTLPNRWLDLVRSPQLGLRLPLTLSVAGDDFTRTVHSDTYPAIDSSQANCHGKVVFVAGTSKGVGRSIALSFTKAGLIHCDRRAI